MTRNSKVVLAALAALAAAAPMSAFAAPPKPKHHSEQTQEQFASGAVATISATELRLADGESFKVASGVQTSGYKAGDQVNVRFTAKDGTKTADSIVASGH